MNIIVLMPLSEQRGGAEQLLRNLLPHLHRYSVQWTVVFFEDGPMRAEAEAAGAQTVLVPTGRLRNPLAYVQAVTAITAVLHQSNADLVMSWMSKAHLYGAPAALWAGIPAVWYQHDIPSAPGWIDRLITALPARAVVTCSNAAARAQAALRPRRTTYPVHPCVDLNRFDPDRLPSPSRLRRQLDLPLSGPLIGIVGRLQRWKGIHVFVDAMTQVLHHHPDAHGVIVGGPHDLEPAYARQLDARISELGLTSRILRVGYQSDIPAWMHAMDVIVHASDCEPFGMVVIEAMALGKPVVAGREGGPPEIISDGINGLLASYGDGDMLAQQVLRYLDEPSFAAGIGQAARERASDFRAHTFADRLVAVLTEDSHPDLASVSRPSPESRPSHAPTA